MCVAFQPEGSQGLLRLNKHFDFKDPTADTPRASQDGIGAAEQAHRRSNECYEVHLVVQFFNQNQLVLQLGADG